MKMLRLCVIMGLLLAGAGEAFARTGYTLIVAPARYAVMQVASDIVQRHPALLVSYQNDPAAAEPLLHAWDGKNQEWVHITMQEFREVSFIEKMPSRTVLLGDDALLPPVLKDAAGWSPELIRVQSLNAAALVNEFGRIMKWPASEWQWFAKRYNLTLNDESEALRKSSWYDQKGPKAKPQSSLLPQKKTALPSATEPEPAPVERLPPPVTPVPAP